MLKTLLKILSIVTVGAFEIIASVRPQFPKLIKPCPDIDSRLLATCAELSNHFLQFRLSSNENETSGYICNQQSDNLGYTSILQDSIDQNTNIWISNYLLDTPNTLYNVVLHEVLHSMGLNHSDKQGMMNYSVRTTWLGNVLDDPQKLWVSPDGRHGLRTLRSP